jgi:hypothetical protein
VRFLYPYCAQVSLSLSLSLSALPLTAISEKSRLRELDSMLEPVTGVGHRRSFSLLGRGEYSYDVELYASA